MSRRHMFGKPELTTVDSSEDEYEPQSSNASQTANTYEGLEVESSKSETEDSEVVETTSDEVKSMKSNSGEDEDVDQIIDEINAMLGGPSSEPSEPPEPVTNEPMNQFEKVFSIRKEHLNANNEIKKLFGPDESEGSKRKDRHQKPKDTVRNPITPPSNYAFKYNGLSMSHDERDGLTYFVYVHSPEYQKRHSELIAYLGQGNDPAGAPVLESINNCHVEGMLEAFKLYCQAEDYAGANTILEKTILHLQFAADPLFTLTTGRARLEYKYLENRAFHIAILLYSYLLSNKSCHRTALELVKWLLTLDPLDPLGVIFILDVFAIRAREYLWLTEALDFLEEDQSVLHQLNTKYSYALAHFHLLSKKREDLKRADDLLKDALMSFPTVLKAIISNTTLPQSSRNTRLQSNSFFANDESAIFPLRDAMNMYVTFLGARWREPPVLEWLLRNADELIDQLDEPEIQNQIMMRMRVRRTLYSVWPVEICRHFVLIKPMSHLVADGSVPFMPVYLYTDYFNPQLLRVLLSIATVTQQEGTLYMRTNANTVTLFYILRICKSLCLKAEV